MAHTLSGLMRWLEREEWREPFADLMALHLAPPCAKENIALEDLPAIVGEHHSNVLWGCVFEDFLTRDDEKGRNIVDDYLSRRGWNETVPNKRYMTALRHSVMSLYEISDIVRDQGFLARDLVRGGEPVRVNERLATHSLKQWDRMAARIVETGPRLEMAGGALPLDHQLSEAALAALPRTGKSTRAKFDAHALRDVAFVFTNAWLDDALQRILHPTLPHLINGDGDEIAWTTAHYPLNPKADADAIQLALARIPSLRAEHGTFWNWIGAEKSRVRARRPGAQTLITTLDDGPTVLGTLELRSKTLVLEANSRERAALGRALIEPVLGDLVNRPVIETKTVAELMASRPAEKREKLSSGLPPDEEQEILRATLERHYFNLLDENVPMLGNISPRRAAKTATGRKKLVGWLKLLENSSAKDAAGSYDLSWMWAELGVADLRH